MGAWRAGRRLGGLQGRGRRPLLGPPLPPGGATTGSEPVYTRTRRGPGQGRGGARAGAGPSLSSGRVPRNAAFGSYPVHIPAREECEQGVHYAP